MPLPRRRFLRALAAAPALAALGGACGVRPRPGASTAPDPNAQLRGFCDGVPAIDAAERAGRHARARELAQGLGVDALVLEAGPSLFYFTGVRWGQSERPLLYVIPSAGEPRWVGPAFEGGTLGERLPEGARVHLWDEHEGPGARAREALAGLGRVAVDPAMRLFVVDGIRAATGAEVAADPGAIRGCRIVKSEAELRCLRRANEATKAALSQVAGEVRAGIAESELAARVRAAQEAAGLEEVWALCLFGPNAAFPHGSAAERRLADGDVVLVDTGGSLHGYRSDVTRTWLFGNVSKDIEAAWATVLAAQSAGLGLQRPGILCEAVDAAARAAVDGAGHGPGYRRFTHRLGHGIGLQVHEDPYLVGGDRTALAAGMVMSNEPGLYVPGAFGVRIEDIVAITPTGHEVLGPRFTEGEARLPA